MSNIIKNIQSLYQLTDNPEQYGLSDEVIAKAEQTLNIQIPAMLYHYYRELGGVKNLNNHHNQLICFPLQKIGDYIIIATENQQVAVWGLHQDDIHQANPMVYTSLNYDDEIAENILWYPDKNLSDFLLAQAITNGAMGGLAYHHCEFSLEGFSDDLFTQIQKHYQEIHELKQDSERYFTDKDFQIGILLCYAEEGVITTLFVGSQDKQIFDDFLVFLTN